MNEAEELNTSAESELSEETARLARIGRGEEEPIVSQESVEKAEERPEWLPEKFKSPEDLAKAYASLEKKLGGGEKEEDEPLNSPKVGDLKKEAEGSEEEAEEGAEGGDQFSPDAVTKAITEARDAWAETGELTEDHRKALNSVGFDDATINTYLEGVKAVEDAMKTKVFTLAGGEENYRSAVKWAAENWSPEEIAAYDESLENPRLLNKVVLGLMAEYREAVPTEGKLTGARGEGLDRGAVYGRIEEFHADLAAAGEDRNKRNAAIQKLQRSRKAGTIKSDRRNPFGG